MSRALPSCRQIEEGWCTCGAALCRQNRTGVCRRCRASRLNLSHGEADRTPEYRAWASMKARCRDNYTGRGLVVCRRWARSYQAFLGDMGRRPSSRHTLDRKDNGRGYSCGKCSDCKKRRQSANCRWATWTAQARNKRTTLRLRSGARDLTLAEWSQKTGIPYHSIRQRLKAGWAPEDILSADPDLTRRRIDHPPSRVRRVRWRGENLTLTQWAEKTGIPRKCIDLRLRAAGNRAGL